MIKIALASLGSVSGMVLTSWVTFATTGHLLFQTSNGNIPVTHWKALRDRNIEKQDEDYSCGSAAVATILRSFYHEQVTEKDILAHVIKMGEDGTASFADLEKAVAHYGFKAIGLSVSFEQLMQLKIPALVYLQYREKEHFSVVRGIADDGRVRLGDPSWGNRTFSSYQFSRMWLTSPQGTQGKVLLLIPQKDKTVTQNHAFFQAPELKPLAYQWLLQR